MTEDLRAQIVAAARDLDRTGLNRGTSGNISARDGDAMLITPSAVPSDRLTPEMIARMPLEGDVWQLGAARRSRPPNGASTST